MTHSRAQQARREPAAPRVHATAPSSRPTSSSGARTPGIPQQSHHFDLLFFFFKMQTARAQSHLNPSMRRAGLRAFPEPRPPRGGRSARRGRPSGLHRVPEDGTCVSHPGNSWQLLNTLTSGQHPHSSAQTPRNSDRPRKVSVPCPLPPDTQPPADERRNTPGAAARGCPSVVKRNGAQHHYSSRNCMKAGSKIWRPFPFI